MTNAKLSTQLEAAQAQIAQLKNEIATLKNKIKPAWKGQRPIKKTNSDSYCLSHGYAQPATLKRADTRMQRPRATPWVESNGVRNDAEGQLRL
jgi:hypothetical protein